MDFERRLRNKQCSVRHKSSWICWVRACINSLNWFSINNFSFSCRSKLLPNLRKDVQVTGAPLSSANRNNLPATEPLVLWGYEGSPFVRPVRETLCSLGLSHVMVNCGRGSANRDKLFQKTGRFQVPYLEDPNTGIEMFESSDIVKYLLDTYTSS